MRQLLDASLDKVKAEYDVNMFGLLEVTKAFFPLLSEAQGVVVIRAAMPV